MSNFENDDFSEVSHVFLLGVADVTIRQSYKLMLPRAKELFPSDFKFTTPIENLPQN